MSAELTKEKKILKLFEFYNKLVEHATDLIKFALSVSPRTQSLFQGAALPPKPPPEALRRFKDLPDQLKELSDEIDASKGRGWQELLQAVDEEMEDQESAGFRALSVLIDDFLASRPEASKAKLEEVKRMIPQKCAARETLDSAFQALFLQKRVCSLWYIAAGLHFHTCTCNIMCFFLFSEDASVLQFLYLIASPRALALCIYL